MISIIKTARFEAAHFLADYKGVCKNLHGHSYRVEVEIVRTNGVYVYASGAYNGMVFDLSLISKKLKKIIKEVDHTVLNDHPELHLTTAEELTQWFAQ